jgi:predicted RNase H-like nuclease (RuvC/YqgF family)
MDAERLGVIRAQLRRRDEIAEQMMVHTDALKTERSARKTVEYSMALNELSKKMPHLEADMEDLIAEVERLTAENQRLTSELNLARGRFEGAVMAAKWERATTGESR